MGLKRGHEGSGSVVEIRMHQQGCSCSFCYVHLGEWLEIANPVDLDNKK